MDGKQMKKLAGVLVDAVRKCKRDIYHISAAKVRPIEIGFGDTIVISIIQLMHRDN
jgi:hypothetical protein